MSYASLVKNELYERFPKDYHCKIAELAAIVNFACKIYYEAGEPVISTKGMTQPLRDKMCSIIGTCLKHNGLVDDEIRGGDVLDILRLIKLYDNGEVIWRDYCTDESLIHKTCCKKAYIRGAFLSAGTVTDPNKSYHFEISCRSMSCARQLKSILDSFELNASISKRKSKFVIYIKDSSKVADVLNVIKAHRALMDLENIRIKKEMRSQVNRKVNCETANISKVVRAGVKQIEDIEYIRDTAGLMSLPKPLQEIAVLRLRYPDSTLQELGNLLKEPIGKSGVNHRLRKISSFAAELRSGSLQEEY